MEEVFKDLGLSKNESEIYSFLLRSGQNTAGQIIEKTGIHRRNVYDALSRLADKGFVSQVTKDRKKFYESTSPDYIVSLLQEKLDTAKEELPRMLASYEKTKSEQHVMVFQGLRGMRVCWEDMLRNTNYIYLLGATGLQYDFLKTYTPKWIKTLNEKKIDAKVLWNADAKHLEYFLKEWNAKSRKLPSKFITKTQIFLYADKSVIVIWADEPIAIQIRSKKINEGFIKYFDFLWRLSRHISKK
ncbi:MAG TPA: helix-turn-helix domain-containing protein [archaeon]|nr:helix-turn-helix domain-containing protein [archaeon]